MTLAPCIYCGRRDVPRTREHVLQAAFGASATLPTEVCGDCNAAFSPIDQVFMQAVDFYYLGKNMLRHVGPGEAVHDGFLVAARLRDDGLGEFPPQLFEVGPNEWRFLGHTEAQRDQLFAELSQPSSLALRSRIVPADMRRPRLAIIRSRPHAYVVQGSEPAAVETLVKTLRTAGLRPDSMGPTTRGPAADNPPPIEFPTSLALHTFSRALAKIALNFVCCRLGPEVALHREFDDLREFARHGTGRWQKYVVPAILSSLDDSSARAWVSGYQHALVLVRAAEGTPHRENVLVVIGGRTIANVRLQPEPARSGGLQDGTWLVTRFSPDDKSVEHFALPDDLLHAVACPEALGLKPHFELLMRAGDT